MQPDRTPLPASSLIALAEKCFAEQANFRVTRNVENLSLPSDRSLVAEDNYSVVAVVALDSWEQLEEEWANYQAALVALLGRRLARAAPKAWDGYLVLLCSSSATDDDRRVRIERDTSRVRKIVATGEMLRTTSDVTRALDLFMPLEVTPLSEEERDILSTLPEMMSDTVDPDAVRMVVEAYRSVEPPLERLHDYLTRGKDRET